MQPIRRGGTLGRFSLLTVLAILVASFAVASPAAAIQVTVLRQWWSDARLDNYASGSADGDRAARAASYLHIREEGYIQADSSEFTRPLYLFWHPVREDNFTTATTEGVNDAYAAGYQLIRIEGYVWKTQFSHPFGATLVPLAQFWNPVREDNFVTATSAGNSDAQAAGYQFVRYEGWVCPNPCA